MIKLPWKNIGSLFLRLVISCSIVSEYHCAWSITVSLTYKQKQNTLSLIKSFKKLHSDVFFFLSLLSGKEKLYIALILYKNQNCALNRSVMSNSLQPHSPPGSSVHGNSPGRKTGVCCRVLLQGIFPIQGLNPGLLKQADSLLSEPPGKAKIRINHSFMVVWLQVPGRGGDVLMEGRLHEKSHV